MNYLRSTAPVPDGKVASPTEPNGNFIVRIGVFDHLDRGAGAPADFYEDRLRLIELYDRAGLHAYHLAEHHGTPLGMAPSPSVFLSAVAQRTTRLRFGPTVYCLPLYPPLRLIEEICMLDRMSRGRLDLGVGRGISPIEVAFFGLDPAETPAMYREALDFVLEGLAAASAGRDFSFEGAYYRAAEVPMVLSPAQQPHPPLWYGLSRPDSVAWPAARGVNVISNQPPPLTRAITDAYRAEWRKAGRAAADLPMMGISFHLVIAQTERAAVETARRGYRVWRESFYMLWERAGRTPIGISFPDEFDALMETGVAIAGTPAQARAKMAALAAESGVNYLVCRMAFGDLSYEEAARTADLLTREVLPALKEAA
ncbi:MAG: LLM class flavin-dependent oxidoreductase [Rhodospirillaceae bacterium]|nr:LLM class flavin-dependent oxidoreductase [Rhodospirillaceae bacterium]